MRKLILLIAIASIFASCKKEFDLDLNGENKSLLVVEGMITDQNEPQVIKLIRTVGYLKQEKPKAVENATVNINVDGQTIPFTQKEPGKYYAPNGFVGQVGKTYKLTIVVDGKTYEASSKMHPAQAMGEATSGRFEFDGSKFEIRLSFTDNPDKGDEILFKYAINDVLVDTLDKWTHYNDLLTNGTSFLNIRIFGDIEGKVDDKVTVYSYSISKEYADFINAASTSTMEPMPFFPPPGATITGNISNGAVGFFQASATRKITTLLRK